MRAFFRFSLSSTRRLAASVRGRPGLRPFRVTFTQPSSSGKPSSLAALASSYRDRKVRQLSTAGLSASLMQGSFKVPLRHTVTAPSTRFEGRHGTRHSSHNTACQTGPVLFVGVYWEPWMDGPVVMNQTSNPASQCFPSATSIRTWALRDPFPLPFSPQTNCLAGFPLQPGLTSAILLS